ncbi:hypothetical protein Tco_0335879 [Tanacetum coccineum]
MGFFSKDEKDLRPADLLLLNWLQGKDACLDVTCISLFVGMRANSWGPRVALHNVVEKKKMKYASKCADNGYKFIPFVFSTFEEFDKDALDTLSRIKSLSISHSNNVKRGLEEDTVTLLKRIWKFLMAQDIGAHAAIHIFHRISFAIAR